MAFQTQALVETRYVKKYDVFNNMEDRKLIKEFDAKYGKMGFFPALIKLKLARVSTKYPDGAINEVLIEVVNDVADKFKACNDLILLSEYAKEQEEVKKIQVPLGELYKKLTV